MFPTRLHAYAARTIVAVVPVAMVCTYATHAVLPSARPANDGYTETAAITNAPTTIGIADSSLYGMSQSDIDTTLDTLESIGVQNVRIFVPWGFVEPAKGTYDWSYLDEVVNAAAARNMGVLAEVSATPVWDAPSGTLLGAGTPNPTDYASFLTQVATRYGSDISSYEIWNEPNYVASYDPIDPATYTALLKAAYPAIKAVSPNATVIAGALGSVVSFGNVTMDPVTFVQDMFADGAQGSFDALSFHPYQETLEFSQGASIPNSPLSQLNAIEQLLIANGDAGDKVWISEYGLPTSDVSQQTQATYLQNLIDTWQTISYAGPVFIYTAQDTNSASTNPDDTYGIYQSDWTPKLAVAVIQQEIAKVSATAATNPLVVLGQQIANAFAQAVAQSIAQTLGQQIAHALAQAIANALASLGKPTATTSTQIKAVTAVSAPAAATPDKASTVVKADTMIKAATKVKAAPAASPVTTNATTKATTKPTTKPVTTATTEATAATPPAVTPKPAHPTTTATAVAVTTPAAPKPS